MPPLTLARFGSFPASNSKLDQSYLIFAPRYALAAKPAPLLIAPGLHLGSVDRPWLIKGENEVRNRKRLARMMGVDALSV